MVCQMLTVKTGVLKSEPSKTGTLLYKGLPLQCCSCLNSLVPSFTISLFIVYYPDHIPGLCLYNSIAVHIQTEQSWWNQQVWLCAQLREVGYLSLEAKTKQVYECQRPTAHR